MVSAANSQPVFTLTEVRISRCMWEDFDSGNRKFICLVVFAVLFLWGPVDRSWPFWLALRIAYLIAAPLIAMVILKWVWRRWKPDDAAEDRLALMLLGGIAGALVVWAAQTFELAPGLERANAFFLVCISASIIWWRVEGHN